MLGASNARAERLKTVYSDPLSEVYLMFYQAALQMFMHFNKFLQREDPLIPVLNSQINGFLKKLFGRFIILAAIQAVDKDEDIGSLDYGNEELHLPGKALVVDDYVLT